MKSKFGLGMTLVLGFVLATYSNYANAKPDISKTWKGSDKHRTWTVYKFDSDPPDFHLKMGDAFRVEEKDASIQFIPLDVLRGRWGKAAGFFIQMKRVGKNGQILCSIINFDSHPNESPTKHFIKIETDSISDNTIKVAIHSDEGFSCDDVEAEPSHGGVVHAQN